MARSFGHGLASGHPRPLVGVVAQPAIQLRDTRAAALPSPARPALGRPSGPRPARPVRPSLGYDGGAGRRNGARCVPAGRRFERRLAPVAGGRRCLRRGYDTFRGLSPRGRPLAAALCFSRALLPCRRAVAATAGDRHHGLAHVAQHGILRRGPALAGLRRRTARKFDRHPGQRAGRGGGLQRNPVFAEQHHGRARRRGVFPSHRPPPHRPFSPRPRRRPRWQRHPFPHPFRGRLPVGHRRGRPNPRWHRTRGDGGQLGTRPACRQASLPDRSRQARSPPAPSLRGRRGSSRAENFVARGRSSCRHCPLVRRLDRQRGLVPLARKQGPTRAPALGPRPAGTRRSSTRSADRGAHARHSPLSRPSVFRAVAR